MSDTRREESNTRRAEADMTFAELASDKTVPEAAFVALTALAEKHHRGPYDTWGAARDRAAREIGVPRTYAKTIWQRWRVMRDVSGNALHSISVAYDRTCERVEAAADRQKLMREQIENAETSDERADPLRVELASPKAGESAAKAGMTPARTEPKE